MILNDKKFEAYVKKELMDQGIKKEIICKLMNILFVFEDVDLSDALDMLNLEFKSKGAFLIEVDKKGKIKNTHTSKGLKVENFEIDLNNISEITKINEFIVLPIKSDSGRLRFLLGFLGIDEHLVSKEKKSFDMISKMIVKYRQNRDLKIKHKEIFENAGTALCIIDNEGLVLEANKEFEMLSGYNKQEIEGRLNINKFINYEDAPLSLNSLIFPQRKEVRYLNKHSNIKNVLMSIKNIPDGDVRIVSLTDVTNEKEKDKKFDEYSSRYEALFKNNLSVMLIVDPEDGKIVDANDAACEFYGYIKEKILSMKIYEINLLGKEGVFREIKKAVNAEKNRFIFKHRRSNGDVLDVEVFSGPIRFNGKTMLYSIINDITEKKKIEKDKEVLVDSIVYTLASVVETRDPYTAGHQDRVAKLSVAIAEELGLDGETVKYLKIAALLHDIGKIKIPSELLSKPGAISKLEFELIKEHARTSYDLLKNINFKFDIAKVVHQHHERMDGSGYPLGLKGDEILFEARILAVADVVEAMSFHRPYRPALGIEAAIDEIKRYSDVKYDKEIVSVCEKLFKVYGYNFE